MLSHASAFYRLRDPLRVRATRARLLQSGETSLWPMSRTLERRLLYGETDGRPIRVSLSGPAPVDGLVWSSWPGPLLVADSLIHELLQAGVSGWRRFPVIATMPDGLAFKGLSVLGVNGRCAGLRFFRDHAEGLAAAHVSAVEGWDGSDIFLPLDLKSFPLLTERAMRVLQAAASEGYAELTPLASVRFDARTLDDQRGIRWSVPSFDTACDELLDSSEALRQAFDREYGGWTRSPPQLYGVLSGFLPDAVGEIARGRHAGGSDLSSIRAAVERLIESGDEDLLEALIDGLEHFPEPSGTLNAHAATPTLAEVATTRLHQARLAAREYKVTLPLKAVVPARAEGLRAMMPTESEEYVQAPVWVAAAPESPFCGEGDLPNDTYLRVCRGRRIGEVIWPRSSVGYLPPIVSADLEAELRRAGFGGWRATPVQIGAPDGSILRGWVWLHKGLDPQNQSMRRPAESASPREEIVWGGRYCERALCPPLLIEALQELRIDPIRFISTQRGARDG